jgi:hypothetical protein
VALLLALFLSAPSAAQQNSTAFMAGRSPADYQLIPIDTTKALKGVNFTNGLKPINPTSPLMPSATSSKALLPINITNLFSKVNFLSWGKRTIATSQFPSPPKK